MGGLPSQTNCTYDSTTVVIILNLGDKTVGMVVDSVSDVTHLTAEQIRPAPDLNGGLSSEFLMGLGTLDERMLILVDIVRLMSSNELFGCAEKIAA